MLQDVPIWEICIHIGVGVVQDYHKALELYEEACEANDIYGCAQKGYLYLDGKGVNRILKSI